MNNGQKRINPYVSHNRTERRRVMHTAPMPDSAGEFAEWKPAPGVFNEKFHKPECKGVDVRVRCWESSCGGYEDYQYQCFGCGAVRWEEGPDS